MSIVTVGREAIRQCGSFVTHLDEQELGLESEDFAELTRLVLQVADTHAQSRLVSCLEGGYDLGALAESVEAHLGELLAQAPSKM